MMGYKRGRVVTSGLRWGLCEVKTLHLFCFDEDKVIIKRSCQKVWKKPQVNLIKSSTQDSSCVKASIKEFKNYILKNSIDLDLLRYKHAIYIDNLVLNILLNI